MKVLFSNSFQWGVVNSEHPAATWDSSSLLSVFVCFCVLQHSYVFLYLSFCISEEYFGG